MFKLGKTPFPWPTTAEASAKVRELKELAVKADEGNEFVLHLHTALKSSGSDWNKHAAWGWRIFTAWSAYRGVAVIVDQSEPTLEELDMDAYNMEKSGILVLRVAHGDDAGMTRVLARVARDGRTWNERRKQMGLKPVGKK